MEILKIVLHGSSPCQWQKDFHCKLVDIPEDSVNGRVVSQPLHRGNSATHDGIVGTLLAALSLYLGHGKFDLLCIPQLMKGLNYRSLIQYTRSRLVRAGLE